MKSKIKFICAAAAALLLILIFLSRTIYNFNLPSVTAVLPYRGTLTKTELTSGIVKYDEVSMLYSEKGGTVGKVLVREGDAVTKGQPLIQMNYKTSVNEVNKQIETVNTDLEKNINDIRINNDRLNLEIETINANIGNTKRKMGSLAQEVYEPESVSNFELIQSENEIAAAEADLGKSKLMYESGVISRQELENAENALKNLKLKYENTEQNYNDAVARSLEAVTDSEANRQSQLKDYEFQLEAYERELRGKNALKHQRIEGSGV